MDSSLSPDCFDCDYKNHEVLACALHDTINKINQSKTFHTYGKGDFLLRAGEEAKGFYFIKTGLVRSFVQIPSGKEQTFHLRSNGDWLGFRETIAHETYANHAQAVEPTEACFVEREIIQELVQNDAKFQQEVFRQMAKEWREAEEHLVSLGTKQVHEKLAEILLVLDHAQGSTSQLELKVTRDVLATFIGTQTETLVRALSDLKAREYIAVDRNRIQILNRQALSSLSQVG